MDRLLKGTPVCASDGREIGHVAEVRGDEFRIGVAHKRDYWLPLELVAHATPERIDLRVSEAEAAKQHTPAPNARFLERAADAPLFAAPAVGLSTDERPDELYLDMERNRVR